MAGREVREYTNLSDPKDKRWGKGKDKIDDEDITFQRMVAKVCPCGGFITIHVKNPTNRTVEGYVKGILASPMGGCRCLQMQEVAGERGGYLHGRGALDSDDLLYLKEQMEAEEDAERLLRRTEKRAFAAFKKAASVADSSPASVPLPRRVEPKPKSGIRQQDLLKNIVEIKPKRQRVCSPGDRQSSPSLSTEQRSANDVSSSKPSREQLSQSPPLNSEQKSGTDPSSIRSTTTETESKPENAVKTLLGLSYESSDED